jgi:hypothetical protein
MHLPMPAGIAKPVVAPPPPAAAAAVLPYASTRLILPGPSSSIPCSSMSPEGGFTPPTSPVMALASSA